MANTPTTITLSTLKSNSYNVSGFTNIVLTVANSNNITLTSTFSPSLLSSGNNNVIVLNKVNPVNIVSTFTTITLGISSNNTIQLYNISSNNRPNTLLPNTVYTTTPIYMGKVSTNNTIVLFQANTNIPTFGRRLLSIIG